MKRPPPSLHKAVWEQFSFLHKLSEDHVEKCIERMTIKTFRKGEAIVRKGQIGTSLFFLDVGHAQAVLDGKVLSDLRSGACFGEIAFVASCKKVLRIAGYNEELAVRVCDVVAMDVVRLVELTVRDFLLVMNARECAELLNAMDDLDTLAAKNKFNLRRKSKADEAIDGTDSTISSSDTDAQSHGWSPDILPCSNSQSEASPLLRPNPSDCRAHSDKDISCCSSPAAKNKAEKESSKALMAMYVHAHALLRIQARNTQQWDKKAAKMERIKHAITLFAAGWLERHGHVACEEGTRPVECMTPAPVPGSHDAVYASRFDDAYALGDVIGHGTFAVVRACTHKATGDVYAVKSLRKDTGQRSRIQNEIAALSRCLPCVSPRVPTTLDPQPAALSPQPSIPSP